MTKLQIPTAPVFAPLLGPSRFKGAHGGRGSGKSHFFAEAAVEWCVERPGSRILCIREVQKDLRSSSKTVVDGKIQALGVGGMFTVRDREIATPGGGLIVFQGMQDHTAESVKSLEGFDVAWVDEAQMLSPRSLQLLIPTIRKPGSELWFSWNPTLAKDAVDKFLRQDKPENAVVVQANWRDNPWWNATMEADRVLFLNKEPEQYPHIYEGQYAAAFSGAYFAKSLTKARLEGRIGVVPEDPIVRKVAYWDIGGAGHKADATAIWIVQFVGLQIRALEYIEGVGQSLSHYAAELRNRGYDGIRCILPHDGINANNFTGKRFEEHLNDAGFPTEIVPNQGAGAAMMRIEAARRIFPQVYINEATCKHGILALGYYHAKIDDKRGADLGPAHDWSSHCADAFGLMAIHYEDPERYANRPMQIQAADDLNPAGVFIRGGRWDASRFGDAIEE